MLNRRSFVSLLAGLPIIGAVGKSESLPQAEPAAAECSIRFHPRGPIEVTVPKLGEWEWVFIHVECPDA